MKLLLKQVIQSIMISVVIPGIMFSAVSKLSAQPFEPQVIWPQASIQPTAEAILPVYIPVLQKSGETVQMELEAYVCGAVLGEMPASFEMEALKAQAVAARTYALRCGLDGVHPENAVCKEYSCCQSYCDPEGYIKAGGKQSNLDKIRSAVEQTRGIVATYNGKLIFAAYFASSGGSTEDAVSVWGRAFPYLKPVDSPGEKDEAYQNSKVTFSATTFCNKLGVKLSGSPKNWFGKVTYTDGGGVASIVIGGKSYSGVKIRSLLGLRSTVFTVSATDTTVEFRTNGYGHRVGMSQYGADAMALSGCGYDEIIQHYYSGVELRKYPFSAD